MQVIIYKLELPREMVFLIAAALAEMPYKRVQPVLDLIGQQVKQQDEGNDHSND